MSSRKIICGFQVLRHFGIRWCAFRLYYAVLKKTVLHKRRFPARSWTKLNLADWMQPGINDEYQVFLQTYINNGSQFFFAKGRPHGLANSFKVAAIEAAQSILNNRFRFFFDQCHTLGSPPNWLLNPDTGKEWPKDIHWTKVHFHNPELGDIKYIWEPSRFAWAYSLARAYSAAHDEKYAEKFWEFFESWLEANQPNLGPNYACGQECAIRLMAMCFALYTFWDSAESTNDRKIGLITAIVVHADRIEGNIDYAISTRTNHSLTESAGLYTVGLLFPELKKAAKWRKIGKKIFIKEALKQIYQDGSYIQQSLNYHRLMLQDCIWVLRLAELNHDTFPAALIERIDKSVDFLYQMQDEKTGRVPNYGANDGALILPLNSCDYLDYRPVIQAGRYLLHKDKPYDKGPWDEDLLWLFGPEAMNAPKARIVRKSNTYNVGGYYTIRGNNSWGMVRCHSYKERVVHVDPLHFDLWADGVNILRDCGTFKYYNPENAELEYYFKSIWAHNTVVVDNTSPLELVSQFTWLPWPKAGFQEFNKTSNRTVWRGRSLAYNRKPWLAIHSRKITVENDHWEIFDEIHGQGSHIPELRWHVPPETRLMVNDTNQVQLELSCGWVMTLSGIEEKDITLLESDVRGGWESLYYGQKKGIKTIVVRKENHTLPITFRTIVEKTLDLSPSTPDAN